MSNSAQLRNAEMLHSW